MKSVMFSMRKMKETVPLEKGLQELLEEASRLSFQAPVIVNVSEETDWPTEWRTQRSWPTDPPIFLCINWKSAFPASVPLQEATLTLGVPATRMQISWDLGFFLAHGILYATH